MYTEGEDQDHGILGHDAMLSCQKTAALRLRLEICIIGLLGKVPKLVSGNTLSCPR